MLALHRERVATLGAGLLVDPERLRELSAEDGARLDALGYSEPD